MQHLLKHLFLTMAMLLTLSSTLFSSVECQKIFDVRQFVQRFYVQVLDREAEHAGLDDWTNTLVFGQKSGADVAYGFAFSKEYLTKHTSDASYLGTLYRSFFNRTPDEEGFAYWLKQMHEGMRREEVLHGFVYSKEFEVLSASYGIQAYKTQTSTTALSRFVKRFYTAVLGREADSAGLKAWVEKLRLGHATAADIAEGFVFSVEYDEKSKDDSTFLHTLYKAFFNREPDEEGFAYWLKQMHEGMHREEVLQGFLHAQEFLDFTHRYGLRAYEGVPLVERSVEATHSTSQVKPYAKARVDKSSVTANTPLHFSSKESMARVGSLVCTLWSEKTKLLSQAPNYTTHIRNIGTHKIDLMVVDTQGMSASDSVEVKVEASRTDGHDSNATDNTHTDTTSPTITLNGDANVTLEQNTPYTEEGATAVDDVDGNVSVSINGTVDTSRVGTCTLTYTAKDKAGNEASVSREVKVISKYKILITSKKGNTAYYGGYAYFNIALSHKPTHPVEVYVESDNPNEGIVPKSKAWGWDMKTGRIVIHPEDWKEGEQIVVKGTNKNVINGKQDYHIITSPAVSDDPHFDGVDAEDVHMVGAILKIGVPNEPQVFFSGIEKVLNIWLDENSEYAPYDYPKITLVDKPEGMVEHEYKGFVWKPTKEDEGKTFHIKAKVNDNTKYRKSPSPLHDEVDFDVRVAKPYILKQELKNHVITVTDENSFLKGVTIEVIDKSVDISGLKLVTLDEKDTKGILQDTRIGKIFMLNKWIESEMKLRVPLSTVPKGRDKKSINLFLRDSTDNYHVTMAPGATVPNEMWFNASWPKEFKKYLGKDIVEFSFGGVRPFYLDADAEK